ncbi:MAG TPA: LysR family transcriptional regulator [Herbaspirillum sp.]
MELRHFRCFAAVAENLHFARAAAQIGISPPALTKQIQEIERLLEVRLFQRTKRSVALTSAGEIFWVEARRTLEQAARAEEAARRAGRGEIGRIEIGYVASAAYSGLLQTEIARFRQTYPDVKLNLSETQMDSLPQLVGDGGMDLAFIRPPMDCPGNVTMTNLLSDRWIVALTENTALAQTPSTAAVRPAELAGQRFILPEQAAGALEVGRRGRFVPNLGPRPGGLVAVITLVSLGEGVAIVPASVLDRICMPGVVYREISGKPIQTGIAVAYRRHEKSPAVRAFIRQITPRRN